MKATKRWVTLAVLAPVLCLGACDNTDDITVPDVYLIAGQVADPTTSPFTGIAGVTVRVPSAPDVEAVVTDNDGNFVLHGVPVGVHPLRAELAGYRTTLTIGLDVSGNIDDAGVPLFTDAQVDSILQANSAPAWDRGTALFGAFARRSNGLALGSADLTFSPNGPHAGGTLVQTGVPEDPIVIVNAVPGNYYVTVTDPGFLWNGPYQATLEAGTITFGAPKARPNLIGFVFADRSTGTPVAAANVDVTSGPPFSSTITDFLGQFSLVGVQPATYSIEITRAPFLPTLSWPEFVDVDTTRNYVLFHPDSLVTWINAAGGPSLTPTLGHIAVEARSASGGALLLGATLDVGGSGFSVAQDAFSPALMINLAPGEYEVKVFHEGTQKARRTGVMVRAGEVSFVRLNL